MTGCHAALADVQNGISGPFLHLSLASAKAFLQICDRHNLEPSPVVWKQIRESRKKWKHHLIKMKQEGAAEIYPVSEKESVWGRLLARQEAQLPNLN